MVLLRISWKKEWMNGNERVLAEAGRHRAWCSLRSQGLGIKDWGLGVLAFARMHGV